MRIDGNDAPVRRNRPFVEVEQEKQSPKKRKKRQKKAAKPKREGIIGRSLMIYILLGIGIFSVLALANNYHETMACRDVAIHIKNVEDNEFLDILEIKKLIGLDYGRDIIGEPMSNIELRQIEKALLTNAFIKETQVYKSVLGVVNIDVEFQEPVARLMSGNGVEMYVNSEGFKFPLSKLHTANVMLVRTELEEPVEPFDTLRNVAIENALPLLRFIYSNPFWSEEVSEVVLEESGELILYLQVGDFFVEFGQPEDIEEKFRNLFAFMKNVMKKKGWKAYKGVRVKYLGQVTGIY